MQFFYRSLSLFGTLLFSSVSFAGGGEGGISAENRLIATCGVTKVVAVQEMPNGEHVSFRQAKTISLAFFVGQKFVFQGGKYQLNEKGSFDALYRISRLEGEGIGHPDFHHYEMPKALIHSPLTIPFSHYSIKTSGNVGEKDFPNVDRVFLGIETSNSRAQFKVFWEVGESWRKSHRVSILSGEMNCIPN